MTIVLLYIGLWFTLAILCWCSVYRASAFVKSKVYVSIRWMRYFLRNRVIASSNFYKVFPLKPDFRFAKSRSNHQLRDFIVLVRQLLYFQHFQINLHAKLRKCVPMMREIQPELNLLITDWYEDPENAIRNFNIRLNNAHADGLCETLISIFQYEHAEYYKHLEMRMNHFKQLLQQQKESGRESRSYFLYLLSGLPLIHSFQIFIYPWMIEGTRLFDQLN